MLLFTAEDLCGKCLHTYYPTFRSTIHTYQERSQHCILNAWLVVSNEQFGACHCHFLADTFSVMLDIFALFVHYLFLTFHHIWTLVAGYVLFILVNYSLWLVDDWYLCKSWTYNKTWYDSASVFLCAFKLFSMYLCRNGTWWKLRSPYFYSCAPSCSQTITGLHQFRTMQHRNLTSVAKRVKCSWMYASD